MPAHVRGFGWLWGFLVFKVNLKIACVWGLAIALLSALWNEMKLFLAFHGSRRQNNKTIFPLSENLEGGAEDVRQASNNLSSLQWNIEDIRRPARVRRLLSRSLIFHNPPNWSISSRVCRFRIIIRWRKLSALMGSDVSSSVGGGGANTLRSRLFARTKQKEA